MRHLANLHSKQENFSKAHLKWGFKLVALKAKIVINFLSLNYETTSSIRSSHNSSFTHAFMENNYLFVCYSKSYC